MVIGLIKKIESAVPCVVMTFPQNCIKIHSFLFEWLCKLADRKMKKCTKKNIKNITSTAEVNNKEIKLLGKKINLQHRMFR